MKRLIVFFFCIFFISNIQAQIKPFAPLGAQWSFRSYSGNIGFTGRFLYVKEQIMIDDKLCSVICKGDNNDCTSFGKTETVYSEGRANAPKK